MKLTTPKFPKPTFRSKSNRPTVPATRSVPRPSVRGLSAEPAPATALKRVAGGLASPDRKRNVAAMIAGLAFIIIAGAIGASVASAFDDGFEVLVAERNIAEGESLSANDFRTVKIAAKAGDIEVLTADSIDDLVGRVAAGPIGNGSMIHRDQFTLPYGEETILVGAALGPNQFPSIELRPGDRVRLIALAGSSSTVTGVFGGGANNSRASRQEIAIGEITDVVSLGSSRRHFSIRVPESTANLVVQLAATSRISLGLLDESVDLDVVNPLRPQDPVAPHAITGADQ